MGLVVDYGSVTDVGAIRQLNEDSVLAQPPLFLVADGMGGHAAGEVASELAVGAMLPLAGRSAIRSEDVVSAIDGANAAIVERALHEGATRGMGTTLAGFCLGIVGGLPHLFVFNVGDSRVYRFAEGVLEQLTTDHTEVEEMIAAGQIAAAEARTHPDRNIITRSLGSEPAPVPDMWVIPAQAADTYLVCSDGLTGEIDDAEIAVVLSAPDSAQATAEDLCRRALLAGGRDNISAVVVRIPSQGQGVELDVATAPRAIVHGGSA